MRRGMNTLALQVQEGLGRDPHGGDLFVFRGRRGELLKILWHDGVGVSLYTKRLERARPIYVAVDGGRCGVGERRPARLPARRNRLAQPRADLAPVAGGVSLGSSD